MCLQRNVYLARIAKMIKVKTRFMEQAKKIKTQITTRNKKEILLTRN